jgi:predicted N-formylglutamate amidohydrolase
VPYEPYEVVGDPAAGGPFVFTCEHATHLLPEWVAEPADLPLLEDHWGWDVGAADLTRALIELTRSCGVLSRFSRLVCDPNRDASQASFVVEQVEGQPVSFNRGVNAAERRRRQERYFDRYHDAVDRTIRTRKAVGAGVLFDAHDEHAWRLEGALAEQGFETVLNAPYSGRDGLIYSAQRHGRAHDIVYLELEVRQDLIDPRAKALATGRRIAQALAYYAPRSQP